MLEQKKLQKMLNIDLENFENIKNFIFEKKLI